MKTKEDARANLRLVLPELKKQWEAWRDKHARNGHAGDVASSDMDSEAGGESGRL
jgi:hypothetical protein